MKKMTTTTLMAALLAFAGAAQAAPFDPMAADRYAPTPKGGDAPVSVEVRAGGAFDPFAAHRYSGSAEGAPAGETVAIEAGGAFSPFAAQRYTR